MSNSGGKRSPRTHSRSALWTPSPNHNNHNHTPTATPSAFSSPPRSHHLHPQSSSNYPHNNMSPPPTPPAEHHSIHGGGVASPSNGNGTPNPTKPGAPSFAAVVSSSLTTSTLGSALARPPLPAATTGAGSSAATSAPLSSQIQKQKHAQSLASSSLALNSNQHDCNNHSTNDTNIDTSLNANAHTRTPSLASSLTFSRYHSPLASPSGGANDGVDLHPEGEESSNANTSASTGESSDIEIYIDAGTLSSTLKVHDAAARMRVAETGDMSSTAHNTTLNTDTPHVQPHSRSPTSNGSSAFGAHDRPEAPTADLTSDLNADQVHTSASTLNANSLGGFSLRVTQPHLSNNSNIAHRAQALSPLPLSVSISSASPSQSHQQSQAQSHSQLSHGHHNEQLRTQHQQQARSPSPLNPPRAPVYTTIPLPEVDACEYPHGNLHDPDGDACQLQQLQTLQHQQQHQQQNQEQLMQSQSYASSIDLAGLSIDGAHARSQIQAQPQLQQSLGIPTSQSHSLLSIDTSFGSHSLLSDVGGAVGSFGGLSTSPSPSSAFPTSASDSALGGAPGQKTPNVYINGLPPHFPEDQLFALASPFGEIRSVRTFTRHVRDSESGYGFVLFETVDAAERCIISLRRYRNLHPTFSKQIHKIPGTTYAQGVVPHSSSSSWDESHHTHPHDSGGNSVDDSGSIVDPDGDTTGSQSADASFKAKMESLQDPTSTNLYMEGLPLSIDEPTLTALVSPHRISSSRFFQTRLSNPPRIIAFVRLETRLGAEEIIERLHGRMVRGWNDTGSRISVRFADTSEQRELRRQERSTQEGDGSPARLTIAQAALLNLRGQELRPANPGPVIHAHSHSHASGGRLSRGSSGGGGGFSTSVSAPDFASNAQHLGLPVIGTSGGGSGTGLEVDYSLAPGRGGSRARSPYQTQYSHGHGYTPPPPPLQASSTMDPAMSALLDSLRTSGVPFQPQTQGAGGYGGPTADLEYSMHEQNPRLGHGYGHGQVHGHGHGHQNLHHLPTAQSLDNLQQYGRTAPAYTRSGYTAMEEYIMRAHAESAALAHAQAQQQLQASISATAAAAAADRRRPAPLDLRRRRGGMGGPDDEVGQEQEEQEQDAGAANIAVGVRAYRAQASLGRVGRGLLSPSSSTGMMGSASMGSMTSMGSLSSVGPSPRMDTGGMNEDDFHASAAAVGDNMRRSMGSNTHTRPNPNLHPAHVNARLSRQSGSHPHYQQQQVQRPPIPLSPSLTSATSNQETSSPTISAAADMINYQHAAAHMRSTTLPPHRTSSVRDGQSQIHGRGHYQHNSMSMPAQNLRTPQHAGVAVLPGTRGIDGVGGTIYESDAQEQGQPQIGDGGNGNGHPIGSNNTNDANTSQAKGLYAGTSPTFGDSDGTSPSPSLISPTLTYSSHTPSTLSPATPFFGSFNSQSEGFEKGAGPGVGLDHQQQQQPQKKYQANMNPSSLRSLAESR